MIGNVLGSLHGHGLQDRPEVFHVALCLPEKISVGGRGVKDAQAFPFGKGSSDGLNLFSGGNRKGKATGRTIGIHNEFCRV